MDALKTYRVLIRNILEEEAAVRYSSGDYRNELGYDTERDRYLVLATGWDGRKRVPHVVMPFDLCGGKIWIQDNKT